jgi:hypothetical protein
MLFAPAELYPYDWWAMRSITLWRIRWTQSDEYVFLRNLGEMTYFAYHHGEAYKKLRAKLNNL